jgi:choline transport protein
MKKDSITVLDGDITEISDGEAKSVSSDDALLMSMGKTPELRRVYNFWTRMIVSLYFKWSSADRILFAVCAYQIMISCSWSCLVVLYSTIFDIGGPFSLVWGTWVNLIAF